jgi:hypothetical protein
LLPFALLAIVRIPSALYKLRKTQRKLTETLIKLQTGETVYSINAFLWDKKKYEKRDEKQNNKADSSLEDNQPQDNKKSKIVRKVKK